MTLFSRENDARRVIDRHGVEWTVRPEGLPGADRTIPGGVALQFAAGEDVRYLRPFPIDWDRHSDEELLQLLERAVAGKDRRG